MMMELNEKLKLIRNTAVLILGCADEFHGAITLLDHFSNTLRNAAEDLLISTGTIWTVLPKCEWGAPENMPLHLLLQHVLAKTC